MAADDRLLKRSETITGASDNNMLNPYREFEYYFGMRQQGSDTYPSIWYSERHSGHNIPSQNYWYNSYPSGDYSSDDGNEVLDYELGTSSPVTPLRNNLIPTKKYLTEKTLYYITIGCEAGYNSAYTEDGTYISYKFQLFFGWNYGYKGDGTSVSNDLIYSSSLSTLKTTLTGDISKRPSAFAFAEIIGRASNHGGVTWTSNGTNYSPPTYYGTKRYYAQDGLKKEIKGSFGFCADDGFPPGSNTIGSPDYMCFWVPGNYHDTTDPNTYFIYGLIATDIKLNPGSYFQLCYGANHHTTRLYVSYIGDDSNFTSSGFLNSNTNSQDRKDQLRYIYKVVSNFCRGFGITTYIDDELYVSGLRNQIYRIRLYVSFMTTPFQQTSFPYSKTLVITFKDNRTGQTVTLTLNSRTPDQWGGGGVILTIDNTGNSYTSTGGTGNNGSSSPTYIEWWALAGQTITITSCTCGGTNVLSNISNKTITLNPSGLKTYLKVSWSAEYGATSSNPNASAEEKQVKFRPGLFSQTMEN